MTVANRRVLDERTRRDHPSGFYSGVEKKGEKIQRQAALACPFARDGALRPLQWVTVTLAVCSPDNLLP